MNKFLSKNGRQQLQIMSNMIRFNNEIHIHDENVAEHSFYVALFSMLICDSIGLSGIVKQVCIEKALIHDVHEIEVSDIPHNVKAMIPGLIEKCNEIENKYNEEIFDVYHDESQILSAANRLIVSCVVNIADVLSVIQYSDQEICFGNVRRFDDVNCSAYVRLYKEMYKLEKLIGFEKVKKLGNEMEIDYVKKEIDNVKK